MMPISMHRSPTEDFGTGPGMSSLTRAVERASAEIIAARTLDHDRLQKPYIAAQRIDEGGGVGAFILAEHIDNDGGWCGDQFRYSVWLVYAEGEPRCMHSDHSWYRPELLGSSSLEGRNPEIQLLAIHDDGILLQGSGCNGDGFGGSKRFIVSFEGGLQELQAFTVQARNHIEQIGDKLGYDSISAFVEIPGEQIAAVTYTSENGRDYGYDTIYLVWCCGDGTLRSKEMHRTKEYSSIQSLELDEGGVTLAVGATMEHRWHISDHELGRVQGARFPGKGA